MIVSAKPFLLFEGNCAQALELYQQVFNSEILETLTFGEMFSEASEQTGPTEERELDLANKIAFSTVKIGDLTFSAGDNVLDEQFQLGTNIALLLEIESKTAIKKVYTELLANDSVVVIELGKSAWSELYAKLKDKYGMMWELNFQGD